MANDNTQSHWNDIFAHKDEDLLGWYETDLSPSWSLIKQIPHWQEANYFICGGGTSGLTDELAQTIKPNKQLCVNDISQTALDILAKRLTDKTNIQYLCQDISQPIKTDLAVDIWLDRAVLHFITADEQVQSYLKNLKKHLKIGGYALLAEFSTTGATQCANLPIKQYSQQSLIKLLGKSFAFIDGFNHQYINPRGQNRPYVYTLFKYIG